MDTCERRSQQVKELLDRRLLLQELQLILSKAAVMPVHATTERWVDDRPQLVEQRGFVCDRPSDFVSFLHGSRSPHERGAASAVRANRHTRGVSQPTPRETSE